MILSVNSLICLRVSKPLTMQMYLSVYIKVLMTTKMLDYCMSPVVALGMGCIIFVWLCNDRSYYALIRHIIPAPTYGLFPSVLRLRGPIVVKQILSLCLVAHENSLRLIEHWKYCTKHITWKICTETAQINPAD
jgi:hypothetical protein